MSEKEINYSGRCEHTQQPTLCAACAEKITARNSRLDLIKRQAILGGSKLHQSASRAVGNR